MTDDKSIIDKAAEAVDQGGERLGQTVGGPLGGIVDGAGGFLGKALSWLQDGHNWMKTNMPGPYKIGLLLVGAPLLMRIGKGTINAFGNLTGSEKLMNFGNQKGFMGTLARTALLVGGALGVNALLKKGFKDGQAPVVKNPGQSEAAMMRRKALGLDQDNQPAATQTKDEDVQPEAESEAETKVEAKAEDSAPAAPAEAIKPEAGTEDDGAEAGAKTDENRQRTSAFQMERDKDTPDVTTEFNKAGQGNDGSDLAPEQDPVLGDKGPDVTAKQPEVVSMVP